MSSGRSPEVLIPTIEKSQYSATDDSRHDDPAPPHTDAGSDGGEEERETLLAKGPLERRRHSNVVAHPNPPRQFDVASRAACVALERLPLGQVEERRHPLEGDPPLHPAMPSLRHRTMDRSRT